MTDATNSATRTQESFRGTAILAYLLYLLGWPTLHMATIVALILAYVQRSDSRGTIWESHFSNIIETFWISLIVGVVAIPLCFVGVGFLVLGLLFVWFLYRAIKGLIRALDNRAYS
jgi:uncharacterized membrane protein